MILSSLFRMVRRGSLATSVMSLNHSKQVRTCQVFRFFRFSSSYSPLCDAYGWLRSSFFIAVFFPHFSRLHPRTPSSRVFSVSSLSTASLHPQSLIFSDHTDCMALRTSERLSLFRILQTTTYNFQDFGHVD
jgi:hypothetical protein